MQNLMARVTRSGKQMSKAYVGLWPAPASSLPQMPLTPCPSNPHAVRGRILVRAYLRDHMTCARGLVGTMLSSAPRDPVAPQRESALCDRMCSLRSSLRGRIIQPTQWNNCDGCGLLSQSHIWSYRLWNVVKVWKLYCSTRVHVVVSQAARDMKSA